MSKHFHNVCNIHDSVWYPVYNRLESFLSSAELATLISGLQPSGCPLPCSIVSTEVQLESESEGRVGFQLYFHQTVQVMFVICQRYVFSEEI